MPLFNLFTPFHTDRKKQKKKKKKKSSYFVARILYLSNFPKLRPVLVAGTLNIQQLCGDLNAGFVAILTGYDHSMLKAIVSTLLFYVALTDLQLLFCNKSNSTVWHESANTHDYAPTYNRKRKLRDTRTCKLSETETSNSLEQLLDFLWTKFF